MVRQFIRFLNLPKTSLCMLREWDTRYCPVEKCDNILIMTTMGIYTIDYIAGQRGRCCLKALPMYTLPQPPHLSKSPISLYGRMPCPIASLCKISCSIPNSFAGSMQCCARVEPAWCPACSARHAEDSCTVVFSLSNLGTRTVAACTLSVS